MRKIYCILAMICVLLIPLNAQSQTQNRYDDFGPTKFLDISDGGHRVTSFMTSGSAKEYAVVGPGETFKTELN